MRTLLAALAILFPLAAGAADWSKQDKALFTASTALLAADWAQTRSIAKQPERFYEKNPLLGRHPSVRRVNNYFAGAILLNYFITDALRGDVRTAWQVGVIVVEGTVVTRNYGIGIRMNLP